MKSSIKTIILVTILLISSIMIIIGFKALSKTIDEIEKNREKTKYTDEKIEYRSSRLNDSINYKTALSNGKYIYYYNENQYYQVMKSSGDIVVFSYNCQINHHRVSEDICRKSALSAVLENIPDDFDKSHIAVKDFYYDDGCYNYTINTDSNCEIAVSVRADTGTVIYYNAAELFEISENA